MIKFENITTEFLEKNRPAITAGSVRLCDYSTGCLFMWRSFYNVHAAMSHGMLVGISGMPDPNDRFRAKGHYYLCPVGGGDFEAAVREIVKDADERGLELRFSSVPEEYVERLSAAVGRRPELFPDEGFPDYLYPYENFCSFSGKALHSHRNHVNRFMREYPDHSFVMLTPENRADAIAFLREHHDEFAKDAAMAKEELVRAEELLCCFDRIGMCGALLYVGDRAIGLTLGEVVGDTLHVDVEKALTEYHGAYQMLSMSFALEMRNDSLLFINRQDDAGDEGLRHSKLSYKPCALLKKYGVRF